MLKKTNNHVPVIRSHILESATHGFFTRQGGVSQGLYDALNCSFREEDPRENVLENRRLALESLGLGETDLVTVRQVHGAEVVVADMAWDPEDAPEADALVTAERGLTLGIQTADCVPLLLADPENGVIGAAHAGWRGALKGVVESTLTAMESLGAERAHIQAAIGPAVGQDSYEVGNEMRQRFLDKDPAYDAFFDHQDFPETFYFDLPGFVEATLEKEGVSFIERLPYNTYDNKDLFFSCRRASHEKETGFGGHISLISLAVQEED